MKKIILPLAGALAIVAVIAILLLSTSSEDSSGNQAGGSKKTDSALIQHLGVEFEDFVFPEHELHDNMVFMTYGYEIPASEDFAAKRNPQPTFILPAGTPVHAITSGTVVSIPLLYSGDYSVQIQPEGSSKIFELEHVIKPVVNVGDTVTAGQLVAEVSDHDSQYNGGYGLVEIGILEPGNPPQHVCPFEYIDPTVKEEMLSQITQLLQRWEEHIGDDSMYDIDAMPAPGCETLEKIEG